NVSIIRYTEEYDEEYGYEPDRKYMVVLRGSAYLYTLEMRAPLDVFEEEYKELFEWLAENVYAM
ncbi:MAG: hypothetical protein IKV16_06840, partial [Clostridia bacterium]|nr:hypothetical protein [Clostridia bacterium]